MEIVVLSANVSKLRYVNVHGREFAVANIRIIVPGVLDGSNGPLYYPPEEIVRNYQDWNGMPLVVYHPALDGKNISARSPEILARQEVGRVYNAKPNSDKGLDAEGWFDIDLVKRVDDRVWKDLVNGNRIEISTGLFTENTPAPEGSTYNGKVYKFIARNYKPDHLAILPDQVGACSIKDGCGVFNAQLIVNPSWILDCPIWNSAEEQAITEGKEEDYAYVTSIYKQMGGRIDDSKDSSSTINNSGDTMDRSKIIAWLTNNCDCYKSDKDAKSKLEKMSDSEFKDILISNAEKAIENEDSKFLEWMMNASDDIKGGFVKMIKKNMMRSAGGIEVPKPEDDPTKKKPTPPAGNPTPTPPPAKETPTPDPEDEEEKKRKAMEQVSNYLRGLSADQWKTVLPPSMVENMNFSDKVVANEKMRIITQLTVNVTDNNRKSDITKKYMQKGLPELQEMLELMPKPTNNQQTQQKGNVPDFFGFSGAPINNVSSVEDDILDTLDIDYEADAKLRK